MRIYGSLLALMLPAVLTIGCGKDDDSDTGDDHADHDADADADADAGYAFDSKYEDGSSVSYTGQTMRQLLITELKTHIGGLTERIDSGWYPEEGEVAGELLFFFEFDSETSGDWEFASTPDNAMQTMFNDISSGKDIVGKLAGNDAATDHKDWATEFVGWDAEGVTSPESLVRHWINEIDAMAMARADGDDSLDNVFTSADGVDRQQLLQKFITGAVTFSQGADDYLDWDTEGKGLMADNTAAAGEGKAYSALEHAWDEGFGYFGANRTYGSMTAAEIKADGGQDADGDGMIDLKSEHVFGASLNAAKRDVGATVETDMVGMAWEGFHGGRTLIAANDGALSDDDMTTLQEHAAMAVSAWEMAVAATVVHYINDVRADIYSASPSSEGEFSGADYAKHWGEAKGFALWSQFNQRSPMSDADFADLHTLLGETGPTWDPSDMSDPSVAMTFYSDLEAARDIVCTAYAFEVENCENW